VSNSKEPRAGIKRLENDSQRRTRRRQKWRRLLFMNFNTFYHRDGALRQ